MAQPRPTVMSAFAPLFGIGGHQVEPELGPIGARLIRAGLFLSSPISPKPLASLRFIGSLANEKSTGLQDHTPLPYAAPSQPKNSSGRVPVRRNPGEGGIHRSSARCEVLTSQSPPCNHTRARRCRVHRIPSHVRD